jgi:hypothetical protein
MAGFRRISTAPTDGTKILAKAGDGTPTIAWYSGGEWKCQELTSLRIAETKRRSSFVNNFQRRSPVAHFYWEPTHWKPLEKEATNGQ